MTKRVYTFVFVEELDGNDSDDTLENTIECLNNGNLTIDDLTVLAEHGDSGITMSFTVTEEETMSKCNNCGYSGNLPCGCTED